VAVVVEKAELLKALGGSSPPTTTATPQPSGTNIVELLRVLQPILVKAMDLFISRFMSGGGKGQTVGTPMNPPPTTPPQALLSKITPEMVFDNFLKALTFFPEQLTIKEVREDLEKNREKYVNLLKGALGETEPQK